MGNVYVRMDIMMIMMYVFNVESLVVLIAQIPNIVHFVMMVQDGKMTQIQIYVNVKNIISMIIILV